MTRSLSTDLAILVAVCTLLIVLYLYLPRRKDRA